MSKSIFKGKIWDNFVLSNSHVFFPILVVILFLFKFFVKYLPYTSLIMLLNSRNNERTQKYRSSLLSGSSLMLKHAKIILFKYFMTKSFILYYQWKINSKVFVVAFPLIILKNRVKIVV